MKLTKEQIKELMEKATKGPWEPSFDADTILKDENGIVYFIAEMREIRGKHQKYPNARFIAALPDIAETAIAALERVEELERERELWARPHQGTWTATDLKNL